MPKKNRLTGVEIRSIRSPSRFHGRYFSLSFSATEDESKFSCIVSKKVAAKAVDRNQIKRRVRAALVALSSEAKSGRYMFHAKKQARGISYKNIQEDLQMLISDVRGA